MAQLYSRDSEVWSKNTEHSKWEGPYKYLFRDNVGLFNHVVSQGQNIWRVSEVTTTDPNEEKMPDYLQEGEELWMYAQGRFDGPVNGLSLAAIYSSWEFTERLVGFAVEDGEGLIVVRNSTHWFTGEGRGIKSFRTEYYCEIAKIIGAVMKIAK